MRKIVIAVMVLFTITATAQEKGSAEKGERKGRMALFKDMTPEEIAELKTKRMTLDLDLSKEQQSKIHEMNLADAKARQEQRQSDKAKGKKGELSKDERVSAMNKRLDDQIAKKEQMRSVLNKEQFEKWERTEKRTQKKRMSKRHQGKKRH